MADIFYPPPSKGCTNVPEIGIGRIDIVKHISVYVVLYIGIEEIVTGSMC